MDAGAARHGAAGAGAVGWQPRAQSPVRPRGVSRLGHPLRLAPSTSWSSLQLREAGHFVCVIHLAAGFALDPHHQPAGFSPCGDSASVVAKHVRQQMERVRHGCRIGCCRAVECGGTAPGQARPVINSLEMSDDSRLPRAAGPAAAYAAHRAGAGLVEPHVVSLQRCPLRRDLGLGAGHDHPGRARAGRSRCPADGRE